QPPALGSCGAVEARDEEVVLRFPWFGKDHARATATPPAWSTTRALRKVSNGPASICRRHRLDPGGGVELHHESSQREDDRVVTVHRERGETTRDRGPARGTCRAR